MAPRPPADPIGETGMPVRALTFGGGGFNTAVQLGAVHALLVSRGKAPDVVLGVSAGAVNAVALAEVMQAGAPTVAPATTDARRTAHNQRVEQRVATFRRLFDAYQRAPAEILESVVPDTYQVEATKPLKPLELPIHDKHERTDRQHALESRAGFIRLYNLMLELRLPIGTLTKVIRRYLGIRACADLRRPLVRLLARADECVRLWLYLFMNIPALAPLTAPLLRALAPGKPFEDTGGFTAGDLIFRSRGRRAIRRGFETAISLGILTAMWFAITGTVLLGPAVILRGIIVWIVHRFAPTWSLPLVPPSLQLFAQTVLLAAGLYGLFALAALVLAVAQSWKKSSRTVLSAVGYPITMLAIMTLAFVVVDGLIIGFCTLTRACPNPIKPGWTEAFAASLDAMTWLFVFCVLLTGGLAIVVNRAASSQGYFRNLLNYYDLADGLLPTHVLRQTLIKMFDPLYYGEQNLDDIVDRALRDQTAPSDQASAGKALSEYQTSHPPIHVGIGAADVATGKLTVLPETVCVIDGLTASMAVAPLFPPRSIDGHLYVDGSNVADEPVRAVVDYLRPLVNPQAQVLHIYSVVAIPISSRSLPGDKPVYIDLIDVVRRAMQLRRFRDATLERRMLELMAQTIPPGQIVRMVNGERHLRSWVVPIEPEAPLDLNGDLFEETDAVKRRDLVATAVAQGCRSAMAAMIGPSVPRIGMALPIMDCDGVVQAHFAARLGAMMDGTAAIARAPIAPLPGSNSQYGPGMIEVCAFCEFRRKEPSATEPTTYKHMIDLGGPTRQPAWPLEWESNTPMPTDDPHAESPKTPLPEPPPGTTPKSWAVQRGASAPEERPLISFLFSGGVFRGVYQMGVLNALSELDVMPDIIAGASIGSITAAMVAQVFREGDLAARRGAVARLAATYLAIDRLILTDRFADFIRNFTLRAAATRFSLRDADAFFRRYDRGTAGGFSHDVRNVTAGLERLFYLTPFELAELIRAFRDGDTGAMGARLAAQLQKWLRGMGCNDQILGAEPLTFLIVQHVLRSLQPEPARMSRVPFNAFADNIMFLATATNLLHGRLEVLGASTHRWKPATINLLEGLLASSAFPGVFRPRWSWEISPSANDSCQYIDGGVMDNLPLDAVAEFLFQEANAKRVAPRPRVKGEAVPHLLFAASLEPIVDEITDTDELDILAANWPVLLKRARQLGYNKKLEHYARTQRDLRAVYKSLAQPPTRFMPLDLEVVAVRPRWLCGTFAFHPMLGFTRARQAESIAHGCASTLLELGKTEWRQWLSGWQINAVRLPTTAQSDAPDPFAHAGSPEGHCWFRPAKPCPFSPQALKDLSLPTQTKGELANIYKVCGRPRTHRPH